MKYGIIDHHNQEVNPCAEIPESSVDQRLQGDPPHVPPQVQTAPNFIREVAEKNNGTCFVSFSAGKDSVATWLSIRPFFKKIIPFYLYLIPDLEFVEKSLRYYEEFFQEKIIRLPHPSLYRMLNNLVFQPPENCKIIEKARLPVFNYLDVEWSLRKDLNQPEAFTALGTRQSDSLQRRMFFKQFPGIQPKAQRFYPIFDWNIQQIEDIISRNKIKLPVDYSLFGRSFDGLGFNYLSKIKQFFPADYEKIVSFFPLIDLELYRRKIYA